MIRVVDEDTYVVGEDIRLQLHFDRRPNPEDLGTFSIDVLLNRTVAENIIAALSDELMRIPPVPPSV